MTRSSSQEHDAPGTASYQPASAGSVVPTALAVPPPSPPELEREVALSRLKGRLFARERPVTLGRYHLLEMVGKGGMGVVWGAWDPQLERRVAIKVMQPTVSATRERMLIEGQALAKLSHPNVVPIYDVGVIDDRVYLVMEWVRGESLREYARAPRHWRDLVAVYRQAGEGLLAAHDAGLIHRDFKPDNAIRGEDGRVRVLDFGLARGEVRSDAAAPGDGAVEPSPAGAPLTVGAGTPRYMAPEQVTGEMLTAAADQYAFCVSLREALTQRSPEVGRFVARTRELTRRLRSGARPAASTRPAPAAAPLPRYLASALERGSSALVAARYPSLRELLDALERDPVRRWRWRGLGAAAVATAAAAFALGRSGAASAPDPCTGGEAELVAVWSPQRVATIQHHLETMGGYGREQAPGVLRDLGQAARGWTESYQQACSAHQRAELTSELYQRRLGCLVRTKVALGTAIEVLGQTRRDGLDNALLAARSLPDATLCAQEDATQLAPPPAAIAARLPPVIASIERARILAVAVHPDAAAVAAAAARDAAHLGYAPVAARAQLVLGRVEAGLARWDPAEVALGKALEGAVEAGDDRGAVEAFARLLWVASRRDRPVDGASIIELVARRTGPAGAFGRALLYNNLATRQLARADRAGARRYLEAAQAEIAAQRGPVDLELVSVAQNLVLVAERAQERERLASAVVEATARALGEHHVKTLVARVLEANETADLGLARQRFAATCDSYQRHHPHLATAVANCFYRLAWLADEAGDLAAATEAMRRAISDPSPERLQAKVAELYVAARSATAGAAALQVQQALQGFLDEHADDKEFWKRLVAVDAAITFAQALTALGDARGAQRQWQRALTIAASLDPPLVQRRLARIRGALAD